MKPLKHPSYVASNLALVVATIWSFAATVQAVLPVNNTANAGPGSLRDTILAANAGDNITFALPPGSIITLATELVVDKDLTISGLGATKLSVVNPNGRVFHIKPSINSPRVAAVISGLRLQGRLVGTGFGSDVIGGCILNEHMCTLTVNNCYFENCHALAGPGADAPGTVFDNTANGGDGGSAKGGAIYDDGDLILYGCTFFNNSAVGGTGGAGVGGGNGGNGGLAQGGAVYTSYNAGGLSIVDCTFFGNLSYGGNGGNGGDGRIFVTHVVATNGGKGGKGGDAAGGGIYVLRACDHDCSGLIHSTVNQNACEPGRGGMGGLGQFGGANGAPGLDGKAQGCGVYTASGFPNLLPVGMSIIAGNYAIPVATIPDGPDLWGMVDSHKYNLLGIMDASSSGWIAGFEYFGNAASPLDPQLGPLQYNGGETRTMAPLAGSPAIDASIDGGFALDQAGQPRPVFLILGSLGSDVGAYELQSTPTNSPASLTITPSGTNVVVAWPWPSTGYILQESPDTTPGSWVDSTRAVNTTGTRIEVVVPAIGQRFFRLVHH